jgi:hypothetical protein
MSEDLFAQTEKLAKMETTALSLAEISQIRQSFGYK